MQFATGDSEAWIRDRLADLGLQVQAAEGLQAGVAEGDVIRVRFRPTAVIAVM